MWEVYIWVWWPHQPWSGPGYVAGKEWAEVRLFCFADFLSKITKIPTRTHYILQTCTKINFLNKINFTLNFFLKNQKEHHHCPSTTSNTGGYYHKLVVCYSLGFRNQFLKNLIIFKDTRLTLVIFIIPFLFLLGFVYLFL